MKRAMLALVGLAIVAGLGFSISHVAFATTTPVLHVPPVPTPKPPPAYQYFTIHYTNSSQFPKNGHYFYMGTQPAFYDGAPVNTFSNINSTLKNKLHDRNTNFMVWRHLDDADDYLGSTTPPGVEAKTTLSTFPSRPGYEFVIVNIPETIPVADIEEIVIHEQGHAFDYAFGPQIGAQRVSKAATSNFKNKVAADWLYINGLARNVVFPRGVPTQKIDKPGGTWTPYPAPAPTVTNEQILKDLYPWLFNGSDDANAELFAHGYQAFRNAFLDDCPYQAVGGAGGPNKLTWEETFTHFRNLKANITGGYFRTMWYQTGSFIP